MLKEQYQNDLDTLKGEVTVIKKALESIRSITNECIGDNYPIQMFSGQLGVELDQLTLTTNTLQVLVDVVLPPVMEQCKSGAWVEMNLTERKAWMMSQASEILFKRDEGMSCLNEM